ncbi:carboxymuconolactone decarboxylase, partial [Gammaproteobacteria bacterium]|nr:carboxymuconolactone decarboxylase [Gammaproteobacteria bacterium]
LRIAMNAAQTPNLISDEDFNDFKKYYDENQQMEILAIVSLFGFLNRWNSSLMTEIESIPSSRMKELE